LFDDGSTIKASALKSLVDVVAQLRQELDEAKVLLGTNTDDVAGLKASVAKKAEQAATDTQLESQQSALDDLKTMVRALRAPPPSSLGTACHCGKIVLSFLCVLLSSLATC
jgi:hypothetical protein